MRKIIMIFLITFFLNRQFVFADCTDEEYLYLKDLSQKIDIEYNVYNSEEKIFEIKISNMNENLYLFDVTSVKLIEYQNNIIKKFYTLKDNTNYVYKIYASSKTNCEGELLLEKEIFIPKVNPFYDNELCEGIEEFYLCDYWYPLDIDYFEFSDKVNEYLNNNPIFEGENIDKEVKIKTIQNFLLDNYRFILSIIIIINILIILIIKRFQRKGDIV